METIFDHNITNEEIKALTGFDLTKEEYLSADDDQVGYYIDIYYLYKIIREDEKKAQEYFDKIPDSPHKYFSIGMFDF